MPLIKYTIIGEYRYPHKYCPFLIAVITTFIQAHHFSARLFCAPAGDSNEKYSSADSTEITLQKVQKFHILQKLIL